MYTLSSSPRKGNYLWLKGVELVWGMFTQGVALGYVEFGLSARID